MCSQLNSGPFCHIFSSSRFPLPSQWGHHSLSSSSWKTELSLKPSSLPITMWSKHKLLQIFLNLLNLLLLSILTVQIPIYHLLSTTSEAPSLTVPAVVSPPCSRDPLNASLTISVLCKICQELSSLLEQNSQSSPWPARPWLPLLHTYWDPATLASCLFHVWADSSGPQGLCMCCFSAPFRFQLKCHFLMEAFPDYPSKSVPVISSHSGICCSSGALIIV